MSKRANEQLSSWCNDCMRDAIDCICADDDWGDEYDYEYTPCTCRYCHCGNMTAHGGKCSDCMDGIHQG